MSQLVAGLVDLCVPSFERVLAVMERAAKAPEEVKDGMRAALERAEKELLPGLIEAAKQGDMFIAGLSQPGPSEQGRSKRSAGPAAEPSGRESGGSTPVPVTRGSGGGARGVPSVKRGVRKGASRGTV